MRQPLWILNSIIFLLVIAVLFFMFFSRVTIPERESLEPEFVKPSVSDKPASINLRQIYEYDIFKTYKEKMPSVVEPVQVTPLPRPPRPSRMEIPKAPEAKFLDPLELTLKGVMSVSNGIGSYAIIEDKTKREANYKVGDMIEDAQLIRIFNNKVIFVRSNGQQEVFYLSEEDAQSDPTFLNIDDWTGIVKKYAKNSYAISPIEFLKRIKNLAQFIDLLGLTSAYRKGESVGCRIGNMKKDSLGMRLGFKKGDVVLTVNNIPATTTDNRLEIYKNITSLKEGDIITVKLQRGREIFVLNYKLQKFVLPKKEVESKIIGKPVISPSDIRKEQKKLLEQKYNLTSATKKIRSLERENMFKRGVRPRKSKNKFIE